MHCNQALDEDLPPSSSVNGHHLMSAATASHAQPSACKQGTPQGSTAPACPGPDLPPAYTATSCCRSSSGVSYRTSLTTARFSLSSSWCMLLQFGWVVDGVESQWWIESQPAPTRMPIFTPICHPQQQSWPGGRSAGQPRQREHAVAQRPHQMSCSPCRHWSMEGTGPALAARAAGVRRLSCCTRRAALVASRSMAWQTASSSSLRRGVGRVWMSGGGERWNVWLAQPSAVQADLGMLQQGHGEKIGKGGRAASSPRCAACRSQCSLQLDQLRLQPQHLLLQQLLLEAWERLEGTVAMRILQNLHTHQGGGVETYL